MARAEIQAEVERIFSTVINMETDVIVFDTDKPVNDSSGLPPVKAVAHQQVKTKQSEKQIRKQQETRLTEVSQQVEDHSMEQVTTEQTVKDTGTWWDSFKSRLLYILLIPVFIIALWGGYKFYKTIK